MGEKDVYSGIVLPYQYGSDTYRRMAENMILREMNSFQGNGNPCCEIGLPKEKKSEKPNFNQTKK